MHGPKVLVDGRLRKVYLVSFMDDASRLITHSAFCPAETALEVEGVLKQALLRRGVPVRLVIDNGSAYRAATMQAVCARLEIRLVYCRPYAPESKGKLERWHRTLRQGFLNELDMDQVRVTDLVQHRGGEGIPAGAGPGEARHRHVPDPVRGGKDHVRGAEQAVQGDDSRVEAQLGLLYPGEIEHAVLQPADGGAELAHHVDDAGPGHASSSRRRGRSFSRSTRKPKTGRPMT